ncbi:MAG: DUF721 domain-containing protein [Ignavibacteria bacterium]|nr:DUF721 domain-containing protein [Ignavibacteria bacterium]
MPDNFKSVSDVINQSEEFKNVIGFIKDYELIENFGNIFPELKKVAVPVKIIKGLLYLRVENSVWRNELKIRQELIISRINIAFNREMVKGIKFTA